MSETEHLQPQRPVAESRQADRERRRAAHGEWGQEAEHTFSLVLKVRARREGPADACLPEGPEAQATHCSLSPELSMFIFFKKCGGDFTFSTVSLGLSYLSDSMAPTEGRGR